MPTRRLLPAWLALLAAATPAAADLLPPDRPIEQAVDHYIDARLKEQGVTPAAQADDANLIRRLTLDLVGRIPTVAETDAYVASTGPDKRAKLVDRLMASPGFARHQVNELDVLLMGGTRSNLREYLTKAVAENRPWDRVFRELLAADDSKPETKGSSAFLKERVKDLDRLTNDVSVRFFGVNVSCAQCHDHPLVEDWKQDHFFGMKSFFARTFEAGNNLGERDYGLVKFKTTKGKEVQAKLMFLTGKVVDAPNLREATNEEQKQERVRLEEAKKSNKTPPPPAFSPRARLADLALQPGEREFFARSIVNRTWDRLFGRGLVFPVDQMHSANPPTHPELLELLARDTVEHGYELRRLIRGLVLSRAYSRSSRWQGESLPGPELFAVARLRAMTPSQLAASLKLATTDPASFAAGAKPEDFEKKVESIEASGRGMVSLFEQPRDDFQIGVGEALLFSNSESLQRDLLGDGGDRLVGRLKQLPGVPERIDLAVRAILARPATAEEQRMLGEYLQKRGDRPVEGCRQLAWALLTCAEFRFNY